MPIHWKNWTKWDMRWSVEDTTPPSRFRYIKWLVLCIHLIPSTFLLPDVHLECFFPLQEILDELHRLWDLLLSRLQEKGLKLQQAQQLIQFMRECDEVMFWISDKETFLTSEETGIDLEHVEVLQKKFDEFQKVWLGSRKWYCEGTEKRGTACQTSFDMSRTWPTMKTGSMKWTYWATSWWRSSTLRRRLSANGRMSWMKPGKDSRNCHSRDRKDCMVPMKSRGLTGQVAIEWSWMQAKSVLVLPRHQELFWVSLACRDADETIEWIAEKDTMLSTEDYGRDLPSVQTLQRKHDGVERDLAALNEKVQYWWQEQQCTWQAFNSQTLYI